jgi:glycosyltransferase involved in cell wall biosynthesis
MNILFVLYGDFSSNSAHPLALYARELHACGHSCAVAVPNNIETVAQLSNIFFRPLLYNDILNNLDSVFPDGRPADIIHAWTPREVVRRFVTSYMAKQPTPFIVYLEDHESCIAHRTLGLNDSTLFQQTELSISERMSDALSHPFRYDSFIGLADAVAVIQDKLKVEAPPWVYCETVMPGVDLEFFSPRAVDPLLREKYKIAENERVIVYHGGLNRFTQPLIETLCRAIYLINRQGYPCRLLRAGPFALNFIDQLPPEASTAINDLGVLPRHELPNLLSLADVFVQPGKIDPFEDLRLPGKLPEFLAMGRPVVMPDVNIAHLFRDGVDAVLTQTGSAEEIAEKCIALFSNPQQADRIGKNGRLFAEKYFDVKSQTKLITDVYKIACDNFNPEIAAEVWKLEDINTPVTILLARKLRLLADSRNAKPSFEANEILKQHSRYMEFMQSRATGLETGITERDGHIHDKNIHIANLGDHITNLQEQFEIHIANREAQIQSLNQAAAEIRASTSWKLTRPIRFAGRQLLRIKIFFRTSLPYALATYGGYRGLVKHTLFSYKNEGFDGVKHRVLFSASNDYSKWVHCYDTLTDRARNKIKARIKQLYKPTLISVVMPVYNPPLNMLEDAIRSVQCQLYPNWELCIADDASTDNGVRTLLQRYADKDSRIKVIFREKNGHISAASNSALSLVSGEYIALLDNDDLLREDALFWVAEAIANNPDVGLIYSDEDKLDESGVYFDPYFKPDWNPDLFLSHNIICHLSVYRTDLVNKLGSFREGYEGAQDYDLALRCSEQLIPQQIVHIPRVLYHWRSHSGSTAQAGSEKSYALLAGERALNDHFARTNVSARSELLDFGMYRARYILPTPVPLVSLIIPTHNGLDLIKQCINSIITKTTYTNFEILIVDNNSDDPEALEYFTTIAADNHRIRVTRDERPFNYSALNNAAVQQAQGEYLGLINNDIEVISAGWLDEMVSLAIQPGVGAVGARLWYPDDTLQHGGCITGLGGVAGHSHKHLKRGAPGFFYRAQLIQTLSAVTAACLVIKKSIYQEVGGLDETNLAVAFNDVDFCLRVKEAGYRNVWTPYAELYHHESATRGSEDTSEKQLRFSEEVSYMKKRWGESLMQDPAYSPNLTLDREDFSYAWPPRVEPI